MRNAVTRLASTFALELRLIMVQWSFLLLQVVWAALVIANFTNNPFMVSADAALMSLTLFIVPLLSLVAMVIAALSASRAKRNRFDLLEGAYPTGAEIVIGRWLATIVALASFLIVPMLVAVSAGPLDAFFKVLPVFLLETLTMLAFVTGVIWLIQVTVGIRRWMYPLFAVVWLGSGFVSSMNIMLIPFSPLISFISLGWNNYSYSETWGRLTIGDLPLYYDLFYGGLVLLLLGVIVWRTDFKRFFRQSKLAIALAGGALALTLFAFITYIGINIGITNQVKARDQFTSENWDAFVLPDEVPYYVSDYDLMLDLADSTAPQFHAQMQVVNNGDEPLTQLDFSLIDQLEITESSVPFEREQDFVRFTLPQPLEPGESLPIDLNYQGEMWYFSGSMIANRLREPQSFINSGGLDLSCASVWYPVPGRVAVGRTILFDADDPTQLSVARNVPDCVAAEPAAFSLQVENPGQLHFSSNLPEVAENTFAANATTWASLIGAPGLVSEQLGNIELITNARSQEMVQPLLEAYYQPALDYLKQVFPDVNGAIITVIDGSEQSFFDEPATPMVDGRLVASLRSVRDLQTFPDNQYAEYTYAGRDLINSLFGQGSAFSSSYMDDVAMFLWAHYKTGGDLERMRTILTDGFPMGSMGAQIFFHGEPGSRWPIARQLLGIYEAQGEEAALNLVREIRAEIDTFSTLSPDAMRGWIEERANAD